MRAAAASLLLAVAATASGCDRAAVACDPFVHIVGGDFGRTADTLWWTLEVEDIPDTLRFNALSVSPGFLEYRWAIDIDSDRSGQTDLSVAVTHFTMPDAEPIDTGNILSVARAYLWQVTGDDAKTIVDINATLTDNTFRFEVASSEAPGLAVVSDRSQSTWTTFYRFADGPLNQCEERWR
jgi:hypothetical protein